MRDNIARQFILLLILCLTACSDTQQLPKLPSDAVILAFGDSLTHGNGARESESYPAVLAQLTGRKVINAGISGEESAQGLQRLPGLLDEHQPKLLILCHGGNDILRQKDLNMMAANVRQMINLAKDRNIPVVLLGVPKFGLLLAPLPVYEEIAESSGAIYMEDLMTDIISDKNLKSDSVHPNSAGYRKMAEEIYAILRDSGAV